MLRRKLILAMSAVATPAFSHVAYAADFDWNGTWRGSSKGRTTSITISEGKVKSWSSNGSSQKIGSASVSKARVTITHAEGAKVTLTPQKDGAVMYNWRGNGNASSNATLRKS